MTTPDNSPDKDRLYDLLPAIIRGADAVQRGQPLHVLYDVLQGAYDELHRDIGRLYEDWFIETCDPWVTPLIGALVGADQPSGRPVWSDRLTVANTLSWRARPGALETLSQAAAGATGWPAAAFDLEREMIMSANVGPKVAPRGSIRIPRHGASDAGPPLRRTARFAVRPTGNIPTRRRNQRNLDTVAIELWTLPVFAVEGAQPSRAGAVLSVHPNGLTCPLFMAPDRFAPTHGDEVADVPRPLTDDLMLTLLADPPSRPPFTLYRRSGADWVEFPEERIRVARLDPKKAPGGPASEALLIVDPSQGLFAFTGVKRQPSPADLRVDYAYGFGGPVGARPYAPARLPPEPEAAIRVRVSGDAPRAADGTVLKGWAASLDDALSAWDGRANLRLEIVDSRAYFAPTKTPILAPGVRLEIGALEGARPVIDGPLMLAGTDGSRLILDGLLISDGLTANDLSVTARDCTIGVARRRGILVGDALGGAALRLERCVVGPLRLGTTDLLAARTIVDGRGLAPADPVLALTAPDGDPCLSDVTFDQCTILGDLHLDRDIDLSSCVMAGAVVTAHDRRRLNGAFLTRRWGDPDYLRLDLGSPDRARGAFAEDWDGRMQNLDEAITRHLPQGTACAVFLAS